MALIGSIENQHGAILRALGRLEALIQAEAASHELGHAVETVRREMLAHERATEQFVIRPLRRLDRLDEAELRALRAELEELVVEALRLAAGQPRPERVREFIRAAQEHIERQSHLVVPVARDALARGELRAGSTWYVDEVHGLDGGASSSWPEQWLG
jgi:hypothetical protein